MLSEQHTTQPALSAQRPAVGERRPALGSLNTIKGALLAVLLLRLAFGLLALPVSAAFPDTPLEQRVGLLPGGAPLGEWLQRVAVQPWLRYDAWNYVRIVEHGYRVEDGTAAFHPLYPLLAAPLAVLLGGNALPALLLVSTIACVALCVVFARYVQRFHPDVAAGRGGWLLLLAPPSFILLAPYNEGLFMALAVGCLWATRERRWWLAGLLGAAAALTRQHGLALALPLAYALFEQARGAWPKRKDSQSESITGRQNDKRSGTHASALNPQPSILSPHALSSLLIPLAYALFVAYRAFTLGERAALARADTPFAFARALLVSGSSEQVVPGQRIAWPWEGLFDQVGLLVSTADYALAIDLLLGGAMVAVIGFGLRRMHVAERLYSLALVGLALCYYNGYANPLLSLPRHLLLAFPLFVVLARWLGAGNWGRRATLVLLLLNVFLAGAFIRHGWVP